MRGAVAAVVAGASPLVRSVLRDVLTHAGVGPVRTPTTAEDVVRACGEGAGLLVSDVVVDDVPLAGLLPAVLGAATRVLVVCPRASAGAVPELLLAGASGVLLLEECTAEDVATAVRETVSGRATLHPTVAALVLQQWREARAPRPPALTPKEQEVLVAMLAGDPVKSIARALGLSARTVDSHRSRIFVKLGVRSHAQAVQRALDLGLVPR
ncbi:response regulator transcription factor [Geodermatophilus sp. Leaf369]|uniref:helix-turn-helix transcriptional regulator n=1 Tax=Geodermatophilus sp. Leaf369 TaxID=1736354 RepID=UPI0012F941A4|nr:response regulator transcription factor [Geodermatophilus sp. Leaf369]